MCKNDDPKQIAHNFCERNKLNSFVESKILGYIERNICILFDKNTLVSNLPQDNQSLSKELPTKIDNCVPKLLTEADNIKQIEPNGKSIETTECTKNLKGNLTLKKPLTTPQSRKISDGKNIGAVMVDTDISKRYYNLVKLNKSPLSNTKRNKVKGLSFRHKDNYHNTFCNLAESSAFDKLKHQKSFKKINNEFFDKEKCPFKFVEDVGRKKTASVKHENDDKVLKSNFGYKSPKLKLDKNGTGKVHNQLKSNFLFLIENIY